MPFHSRGSQTTKPRHFLSLSLALLFNKSSSLPIIVSSCSSSSSSSAAVCPAMSRVLAAVSVCPPSQIGISIWPPTLLPPGVLLCPPNLLCDKLTGTYECVCLCFFIYTFPVVCSFAFWKEKKKISRHLSFPFS